MNEFTALAADLRKSGRNEAADIADSMNAPRSTMKVTHQGQAAYGAQAWNGWRFVRVQEELKTQRVLPAVAMVIVRAIRELEEDERMA